MRRLWSLPVSRGRPDRVASRRGSHHRLVPRRLLGRALVALIVANAIPLFGVLFLGWNVWTILIVYWLENGIVGVFNVLKMLRAEGPDATRHALPA